MEVVIQFKEATENSLNVLKGSTMELEIFQKKELYEYTVKCTLLKSILSDWNPLQQAHRKKIRNSSVFQAIDSFLVPKYKEISPQIIGRSMRHDRRREQIFGKNSFQIQSKTEKKKC